MITSFVHKEIYIIKISKCNSPWDKKNRILVTYSNTFGCFASPLIFNGELILLFHSPLPHFLEEGLNLPRIILLMCQPKTFHALEYASLISNLCLITATNYLQERKSSDIILISTEQRNSKSSLLYV